MDRCILVRYGELFLKSGYVKRRFEDRLHANLSTMLEKNGVESRIERLRNRALIHTNEPVKAARIAARVFGVTSTSPVTECGSSMDDLLTTAIPIASAVIDQESSFAVRAKRSGEHPYSSMDVERTLGAAIVERTAASVNLDTPDTTVEVDIEGDRAFICTKRFPGVRGLPYGTQGRVLAVFDGTDDSVLAAFMLASRGAEIVGWADEKRDLTSSRDVLGKFLPQDIDILQGGAPEEAALKSDCQAIVWGTRFDSLEDEDGKTGEELPYFYPLIGLSSTDIEERIQRIYAR